MPRLNCYREEGINIVRRTVRFIFTGLLLSCCFQPASAGLFGHIATFAAGAVIAHETEKAVHNYHTNAGGVAADGRYAAVSPESAALPNSAMTPGALNTAVTQQNLMETICRPGGYTKSIRPPESYTSKLKREQIRAYGYSDTRMYDYEEDHLISLELGGSPDNPKNLWPEPHHVIGGWGSYAKDKLENKLHKMVCHGQISLRDSQQDIAGNWIETYKRLIGPTPDEARDRHGHS